MGETVGDLLSTIYRKIQEDYEKELLKKGIPIIISRNDEPIKLSKLYAVIDDISSGQKSYDDPEIHTHPTRDGTWIIRYKHDKRKSSIDLFFKYCDIEL